jgi:hypothetical protein
MDVGGIPQLLDNLEGGGLLSLDAVGIDRVDDCKVTGLSQLAHESQGVVKISPNGNDSRSIDIGLDHLASGDTSRRKKDGALHSGTCGIGGGGSGGIAGGGAEDGMGTLLGGLGDRHGHAPILERAGRIQSLVFDIDLTAGDRTQFGRMNQRCGTLAQRDDGRGIGDRQELSVALDHAAIIEGLVHRLRHQEIKKKSPR